MTKTAIVYARFSTADQRHGFSLERQKTLGIEYAAQQGWIVEKTIADEGRSAFHGGNRLEGAELHTFELEAKNGIHSGKVLVVENIDRLSRQGAKVAAELIWGLNRHGVDVATYHDSTTYTAANGGDMMELFGLSLRYCSFAASSRSFLSDHDSRNAINSAVPTAAKLPMAPAQSATFPQSADNGQNTVIPHNPSPLCER